MKTQFFVILFLFSILPGCANVGDTVTDVVPFLDNTVRYSESPQMASGAERKYQSTSRAEIEDSSELHANAGSMWMMEGQSSYLFLQNRSRKEGDSLQVKLEGSGQKQVETKVVVIKKLLKQIEEQNRGGRLAGSETESPSRGPASTTPQKKPEEDKPDLSDVASISAKITDRTPDGMYRIKGSQPLMIDDKEFKVIMTGVLKPDDYNDEGVSSNKLIDPQYDVVSIRRSGGSLF
jgi:flagellar L-ring protein precursor FlgH